MGDPLLFSKIRQGTNWSGGTSSHKIVEKETRDGDKSHEEPAVSSRGNVRGVAKGWTNSGNQRILTLFLLFCPENFDCGSHKYRWRMKFSNLFIQN